jgi:hypothetical protein
VHRVLKRKTEHLDDLDTLVLLQPDEPDWLVARAELRENGYQDDRDEVP